MPPYCKSFLAITQQPIVRLQWNFAWGSNGTDRPYLPVSCFPNVVWSSASGLSYRLRHTLCTCICLHMFVCLFFFNLEFFFARRPAMLGLMGFSGSLPFYYLLLLDIVCINWANKDACLLACSAAIQKLGHNSFCGKSQHTGFSLLRLLQQSLFVFCSSTLESRGDVGLLCGVGYAQHTTNYKLKQLIYICQSVPSFPIGCSDVLLVA